MIRLLSFTARSVTGTMGKFIWNDFHDFPLSVEMYKPVSVPAYNIPCTLSSSLTTLEKCSDGMPSVIFFHDLP